MWRGKNSKCLHNSTAASHLNHSACGLPRHSMHSMKRFLEIRYDKPGQVATIHHRARCYQLRYLSASVRCRCIQVVFAFTFFFFTTINKYWLMLVPFQQYRITQQCIGCWQISGCIQELRLKCDTNKPHSLCLKRFHPSELLFNFMRRPRGQ